MSETAAKTSNKKIVALVIVLAVISMLIPVVLALTIRSGGMELFRVPSGSMYPTVHMREELWVNKFVYGPRLPGIQRRLYQREAIRAGEVVVFAWPRDPSKDFLSRVLATEGQRVRVHSDTGIVEVNGQALARCSLGAWPIDVEGGIASPNYRGYVETNGAVRYVVLLSEDRSMNANDEMQHCVQRECTVPAGHVFTMGDHRDNSFDGRYWGFVPVSAVKGRASVLFRVQNPARNGLDLHGRPWVPEPLRAALAQCLQ